MPRLTPTIRLRGPSSAGAEASTAGSCTASGGRERSSTPIAAGVLALGDAGASERQRQRADASGKRQLLRVGGRDLDGDRLDERRLVRALVGELVDGEHLDVLQQHVGIGLGALEVAHQEHVDALAGQDETGDAVDVVHPHGDGLHALLDDGGERAALAGPGDLRLQHRLVLLERRERDAPGLAVEQFVDLGEGAFRDRPLGPGDLAQMLARDLDAELQRQGGDDDGLRRRGLRHELDLAEPARLPVEIALPGKDRHRPEDDGKEDHDDGFRTHAPPQGCRSARPLRSAPAVNHR